MRESIPEEGVRAVEAGDLAARCLDLNGDEEEQILETEAIDQEMIDANEDGMGIYW